MRAVYLFRRHTPACSRARGDNHRCACPVWADGMLDGRRKRLAMKTSDWKAAADKMQRIERGDELPEKSLQEAFAEWKADLTVEDSTRRKYVRAVAGLVAFLEKRGVASLAQVRSADMQALRASRKVSRGTLAREIQTWRLFFNWCMADGREWLRKNPGKWVSVTKGQKQRPVQPYTREEIAAIIAACDLIGRTGYERARARALVMVLRYTGLRIGDALALSRNNVRDGQVSVYTSKEGVQVWLPLHRDMQAALELLPLPRGAEAGCRYFFWNGRTS